MTAAEQTRNAASQYEASASRAVAKLRVAGLAAIAAAVDATIDDTLRACHAQAEALDAHDAAALLAATDAEPRQ